MMKSKGIDGIFLSMKKRLFLVTILLGMLIGQTNGSDVSTKVSTMVKSIAKSLGYKSYYEQLRERITQLIGNKAQRIVLLQKQYPLDQNWRNMAFEQEIQNRKNEVLNYKPVVNAAREIWEKWKGRMDAVEHSLRTINLRKINENTNYKKEVYTPDDILNLSSKEFNKLQAETKALQEEYKKLEAESQSDLADYTTKKSEYGNLQCRTNEAIADYHLLILSFVAKNPKSYEQYIKKAKKELFEQNKTAWLTSPYHEMQLVCAYLSPNTKRYLYYNNWITYAGPAHPCPRHYTSCYKWYHDLLNDFIKNKDSLLKNWDILPSFFDDIVYCAYSGVVTIHVDQAIIEALDKIWQHVYVEPNWQDLLKAGHYYGGIKNRFFGSY